MTVKPWALLTAGAKISLRTITWAGLANADTGNPVDMRDHQDRCVQITGTFGSGGSVSIEGSNDAGVTWVILTDPLGNVLTFTGAGMKQITELPGLIRPHVTAGDGTTSLNIYLSMRGGR